MLRSTDGSPNASILCNAASLVGTTGVTSVLGFGFWWIAAQRFPPSAVGTGSALISAMTLLGMVSVLGLGTLLMGELSRQPGREAGLITAAVLVSGVAGILLGAGFLVVAPAIIPALQFPLGGILESSLFVLGVGLTALTTVIDQAMIGLLRGELQLLRNGVFAIVKLGCLALAGLWLSGGASTAIFLAWIAGSFASLLSLGGVFIRERSTAQEWRPEWRALQGLRRTALEHHVLNVVLQAPSLILPILVVVVISPNANAYFYPAWMIAGLAFVGPVTVSTALYAATSHTVSGLAAKVLFSLKASLILALAAGIAIWAIAPLALSLFGMEYARQGEFSLRTLILGVFPLIVRDHYVAVFRARERVGEAVIMIALGALVELVAAVGGALLGGLPGLSLGWVLGVCIEAGFMVRPLRAAIADMVLR